MATVLIKNGRVLDPSSGKDARLTVFVRDGRIEYTGKHLKQYDAADTTVDAAGLLVVPGLIDMHTHLREPGNENEETIASGASAAVNGGFTSIACMPNTAPVMDTEAAAEYVYLQAKRTKMANVFPIGAVTKEQKGEILAEMGQLSAGGAVAFSDDGNPINSANVMLKGLTYAKMFKKPIISHCEEKTLAGKGDMNKGFMSVKLALPGAPSIAEELMVHRDIVLAETSGGHVHIAHVSTAGSVDLIRKGKKRGVKVTAEVAPHHLTLTDEFVETFNPVYKMNPPLRTENDIKELLKGLNDGTIDCIASDHAPHSSEEKDVEFSVAPFGVIGLESTLPVVLTKLVHTRRVPLARVIAAMTSGPAEILGIGKGTLKKGADADITVIDLNREWTINAAEFRSKSRNCPFDGWRVKGAAVYTIVGGNVFDLNRRTR